MQTFKAKILIIGINPYVLLPAKVLEKVFEQSGKDKGAIPVKGTINGYAFIQTLVKYSGKWRLYINGPMLKGAESKPGDVVNISIAFDGTERITSMHPKLKLALQKNKAAYAVFKQLPPSRQKEIMKYINNLKTAISVDRNVKKAMLFLSGKERFVGRDKP